MPVVPNKKITLITPPYERIAKGYESVKHITNQAPTLGLLHLAAEVRNHGYQPTIIESDIFDMTVEDVVAQVVADKPSYVGITLFTVGVWCGAEIARKIKFALPETTIIVGGPHISSMAVETMERFREFDIAVVGEGEEILINLLKAMESGSDRKQVNGLVFMEKGDITDKVIKTPSHSLDKNMDRLPMPAWDLLPDFPKAYRPAIYDYPSGPVASIAASRGCPFHCKFCDTSTFGSAVRAYSAQRVFDIVEHLQKEYGIKHIMFVDDLFTASRKRTTELCELLINSDVNITWSCASRVDVIKPDLLHLMKDAGCWEISFGLESGSNELLKKMDKSADVEKSREALEWTHAAGIRSKGLFMLGYPGETEETIAKTKAFVKSVPLTIMNLTKFTPYPGSPIYRDMYKTNIREDHWQKMNGMNFLWAPDGMTIPQLNKHYIEVLSSFYTQPKIPWYYTKLTLQNPVHFFRLLKFLRVTLESKVKRAFGRQEPQDQLIEVKLD
ncbi:MAG TPA: B12-binding domain-containing radical SAM protein [Porticoccus sp.]|nr:B12-binding domain-containing radical SAM protein [Porticoccus sp.]